MDRKQTSLNRSNFGMDWNHLGVVRKCTYMNPKYSYILGKYPDIMGSTLSSDRNLLNICRNLTIFLGKFTYLLKSFRSLSRKPSICFRNLTIFFRKTTYHLRSFSCLSGKPPIYFGKPLTFPGKFSYLLWKFPLLVEKTAHLVLTTADLREKVFESCFESVRTMLGNAQYFCIEKHFRQTRIGVMRLFFFLENASK